VARIVSHPFRLAANGSIATVEQDSEGGDAEQLAVLALTKLGERAVVPAFGITDPTFEGFAVSEFVAGVAAFGPPVRLADVAVSAVDDSTERVEVHFG
jgi:hypothetical protein